jgi:hypothetical protein
MGYLAAASISPYPSPENPPYDGHGFSRGARTEFFRKLFSRAAKDRLFVCLMT